MARTLVILGAGFGGLPVAHYLIHYLASEMPELRVVLVAPNSHFYWNLASIRFTLPGMDETMPEERYLYSIADQFAAYPHRDRFQFLLGAAHQLHPERNAVTIRLNNGKGDETELKYDTLVIATGTSYRDGLPWKSLGSVDMTRAAIVRLREQIDRAQSIVVAGAGATGVEFAGELGAAFAQAGKKKVTLLSAEALPLESRLQDRVRETAKKELEKLNVDILTNVRVDSVSPESGGADGALQIEFEQATADGASVPQRLTADLFVPTYGLVYNTSFAPAHMLDSTSSRLIQDPDLRARGYSNIFVVGDAGSLQIPQAVYAENQARHLMEQFRTYLSGGTMVPYYSSIKDKKDKDKVFIGVLLGPNRATGQMGTFKLPSLPIWWLKGRHIGTNWAPDYVAGVKGTNGPWPR